MTNSISPLVDWVGVEVLFGIIAVPASATSRVPAEIVPVVVIAPAPTSILVNPEVIEPAFTVPYVVILVVPAHVDNAVFSSLPNPSVTLCAVASASSSNALPAVVKS